jgi:hypothetical protein
LAVKVAGKVESHRVINSYIEGVRILSFAACKPCVKWAVLRSMYVAASNEQRRLRSGAERQRTCKTWSRGESVTSTSQKPYAGHQAFGQAAVDIKRWVEKDAVAAIRKLFWTGMALAPTLDESKCEIN